jgi:hypothetical protein
VNEDILSGLLSNIYERFKESFKLFFHEQQRNFSTKREEKIAFLQVSKGRDKFHLCYQCNGLIFSENEHVYLWMVRFDDEEEFQKEKFQFFASISKVESDSFTFP